MTVLDIPFNAALLEIWINGLYACLVVRTLFSLYSSKSRRYTNLNQGLIAALTFIMYAIATMHTIPQWIYLRKLLIVLADVPKAGGPYQRLDRPLFYAATIVQVFGFALNTLIADCLFIWRCWAIWGKEWRVIVVPFLLTVVGTVFSVLADIAQVQNDKTLSNKLSNKLFVSAGITYLSLSFATTLYVTIHISYRILKIQWLNKRDLGDHSDPERDSLYYNIVEVVVESAVLYSASVLVLLIYIAKKDPAFDYPINIVAQATGIAPTLILARLSSGKARPSSTWTRGFTNASIEFATPEEGRSRHTTEIRSVGSYPVNSHYIAGDDSSVEVGKIPLEYA